MRDPHMLLLRALREEAGSAGRMLVRETRQQAWASATFIGMRHLFVVVLPEADATGLAGRLDAIEFALPGHLVADIVVAERSDEAEGVALRIEALTIEDR